MKRIITTAAFVALVMSANGAELAKTAAPQNKSEQLAQELGLTDEQFAKIKTMRQEFQTAQKAITPQIRMKQTELDSLIQLVPENRDDISAKGKEITALQEQMLTSRVDYLLNVKALLTPEQFARFMGDKDDKSDGSSQKPAGTPTQKK